MSWIDELRTLLQRAREGGSSPAGGETCTCQEAVELVYEWLDEELDAEEARRIEEHLLRCARCRPLMRFERSFQEALRRAATAPCAPPELEDRVLEALRARGFRPE